jgi:hypothetical protein
MAWFTKSRKPIEEGAGTTADRERLYKLDKERAKATPQRQAEIDAEMSRLTDSIYDRELTWLEKNKGKI